MWLSGCIVVYCISICNSTNNTTRTKLVSSWVIRWWTPGRDSSSRSSSRQQQQAAAAGSPPESLDVIQKPKTPLQSDISKPLLWLVSGPGPGLGPGRGDGAPSAPPALRPLQPKLLFSLTLCPKLQQLGRVSQTTTFERWKWPHPARIGPLKRLGRRSFHVDFIELFSSLQWTWRSRGQRRNLIFSSSWQQAWFGRLRGQALSKSNKRFFVKIKSEIRK